MNLIADLRLFFLGEPRHGLLRHSVFTALIGGIGSLLVLASALGVAYALGISPDFDATPDITITAGELFFLAVSAPVIETPLLALTIAVLGSFIHSRLLIAVLAALVWGGLHGVLASPFSFFGTVWAFFVLSCCYLSWRPRSLWHALAAAAIPHALVNTFVFVLVALSASA